MWVGAGILAIMAVVWIILSLSTCCVAYNTREQRRIEAINYASGERRRTERGRRQFNRRLADESQPLLQ